MDQPKGTVPPLQEVAFVHREHCICPHLACNRPGQCEIYRRSGPEQCFRCGFDHGADVGYMEGYEDGREDQAQIDVWNNHDSYDPEMD